MRAQVLNNDFVITDNSNDEQDKAIIQLLLEFMTGIN
jgi:hypothetical protein